MLKGGRPSCGGIHPRPPAHGYPPDVLEAAVHPGQAGCSPSPSLGRLVRSCPGTTVREAHWLPLVLGPAGRRGRSVPIPDRPHRNGHVVHVQAEPSLKLGAVGSRWTTPTKGHVTPTTDRRKCGFGSARCGSPRGDEGDKRVSARLHLKLGSPTRAVPRPHGVAVSSCPAPRGSTRAR